jgi:hypothetical protein
MLLPSITIYYKLTGNFMARSSEQSAASVRIMADISIFKRKTITDKEEIP